MFKNRRFEVLPRRMAKSVFHPDCFLRAQKKPLFVYLGHSHSSISSSHSILDGADYPNAGVFVLSHNHHHAIVSAKQTHSHRHDKHDITTYYDNINATLAFAARAACFITVSPPRQRTGVFRGHTPRPPGEIFRRAPKLDERESEQDRMAEKKSGDASDSCHGCTCSSPDAVSWNRAMCKGWPAFFSDDFRRISNNGAVVPMCAQTLGEILTAFPPVCGTSLVSCVQVEVAHTDLRDSHLYYSFAEFWGWFLHFIVFFFC